MIRPPKGKVPYGGTKVPVDRSKQQITELLRAYGAEAVNWTDNFQNGEVQLRFIVKQTDGSAVGFKIIPAAFREKHSTYDPVKGKHVTIEAPDWPRSLRLLHAWVKTKLESVAFGLTSVEEEFLAQRVVLDGSGRETTVGALVLPAIEQGGGRLAIDGPREVDRVIEAEVVKP